MQNWAVGCALAKWSSTSVLVSEERSHMLHLNWLRISWTVLQAIV